MNIVPPKA